MSEIKADASTLIKGIDTIIMRVSDLKKSKQWYVDQLGLTLLWEDLQLKLIVLDTKGSTSLTLWETSEPISVKRGNACYPIFRTDDVASFREYIQLKEISCTEITKDETVSFFSFFDPDGNILEACEIAG